MIACIFEKELEFNAYILKSDNKKYELCFEFYGVKKPKVGDKILINEKLLNINSPMFSQPYAFELDNETKAQDVKLENLTEYIVLNINKKNYVLKRVYG